MVEYSKVNVKLTDTQLKKLKTAVKNKTGTTLRISLKMVNGNNLPHELLLITRQNTKLRNAFNNNISTDLKLSKTQITKINKSGEFWGSLLSKLAGPLMKVAVLLAKNNSSCFRNWCRDSKKKKKSTWFWNNNFNNVQWRNEWYNEIVQALEDSDTLLKGVTETIKNETKEQKERFLSMLLGTSGGNLLGNLLSEKRIVRAGYGNKTGKGIVRAGYGSKKGKGTVRAGSGKDWDF